MPLDIEAARRILAEAHRHDPGALRERIRSLAVPRLSGTEGAETVETSLRDAFEEVGYQATELPFSFSTWPGRFGPTVSGLLLTLTAAAGAGLLLGDLPIPALVVLVLGLALALLPLATLDRAIRELPWGRIESRNLLFTRSGSRPAWIVMAHRDSKSQVVPTLVRTAAVATGVVGWLALVVLAALWLAGDPFRLPTLTAVVGGLTALAGVTLALAWAGNASPGALDNATGLAALLAVADREPDGTVGFLLTDGEELGLAGARAVVSALPPVQGVINVDGLDDRGELVVAEGHGWRRRGSAPQLAAALLAAGRALDIDIRRRRLPRSILVDHLPIAAAGIPALTVLRGGWRSLLQVHRGTDSPDRLDGSGAAETATVLDASLRLLRETGRAHLAGERRSGS